MTGHPQTCFCPVCRGVMSQETLDRLNAIERGDKIDYKIKDDFTNPPPWDNGESKEEKMAISAGKIAPSQGGTPRKQRAGILHGSDLPRNRREITLHITGVREAPPDWSSPVVLDFDDQFGKGTLPLNKTNVRSLGELCTESFGSDDLELLIGHDIVFQKVSVNNPSTGAMSDGLRVAPGQSLKPTKKGHR